MDVIRQTRFLIGLSVDGDSQGIERLYGALTAYMWPGMILKSGNRKTEPSVPEKPGCSFPSLYLFCFFGFLLIK